MVFKTKTIGYHPESNTFGMSVSTDLNNSYRFTWFIGTDIVWSNIGNGDCDEDLSLRVMNTIKYSREYREYEKMLNKKTK